MSHRTRWTHKWTHEYAKATHYITTSKKELLLDNILADFQLLNPKEKTCSFQHVKKELAEKI